jgi:predicted  nucleic acid-binding Zn-ribbon protein
MATKTTTDELLEIKKKIDDANVEKARLEGSLANHMKRLEDLGFKSVEAAEKHLEKLRGQIAKLDKQVKTGIDELHTEYGL